MNSTTQKRQPSRIVPSTRWIFSSLLVLIIAIAITNLGITGYLLALVRDPDTLSRQVYVLSSWELDLLSPMSVVPGWALEDGYWFTLATSLVVLLDTPAMVLLLIRLWHDQAYKSSQIGLPFSTALTLTFLSAVNIIMSSTALAWVVKQDRGAGDKFNVNAPTFGPYHQYTSSTGFTIDAFSCVLAGATVESDEAYLHRLCNIGKVLPGMLVACVVLNGLNLVLTLTSWYRPKAGIRKSARS